MRLHRFHYMPLPPRALILFLLSFCVSHYLLSNIPVEALTSPITTPTTTKFVILGGTGKIGTAVAAHLLRRLDDKDDGNLQHFISIQNVEIILVGRRDQRLGEATIGDVRQQQRQYASSKIAPNNIDIAIKYQSVNDIWDPTCLRPVMQDAFVVIHTAGPYADQTPTVLQAAIQAGVPVYVDVSDPLPFLDQSLAFSQKAQASGTTALCAAGAFPGMSNVLAMEAASEITDKNGQVQDVRFNYFTKGLGGSGTINLYITNIGFGDAMTQHQDGKRVAFQELSGKLLGTVDFFFSKNTCNKKIDDNQNKAVQERVGTHQVFAWPFPEAATVATHLGIKGESSAAMGTAPDLWNSMLGLLVDIVPRSWWRSEKFSKFLADFSQPLVLLTDAILQATSPDKVGETHAMRVDVTSASQPPTMISIVQAHESFRQCVGQSCAEFALDLLQHPNPGVYLPEQRYSGAKPRKRVLERLTTTRGTFCYTGPMAVSVDDASMLPVYPSNIQQVVANALDQQP